MNFKQGLLINLEGTGCSGKTALLDRIEEYLLLRKIDYLIIRNHTSTNFAESAREMLRAHGDTVDVVTQTLVYASIWRDALSNVILPALAEGKIVIIDRYIPSTFFFQATLGHAEIHGIMSHIYPRITDLCIHLRCDDPDVIETRLANRVAFTGRNDRYNLDFIKGSMKHIQRYVTACREFSRDYFVVDTVDKDKGEVADLCICKLNEILLKYGERNE